MSLLDDEHMSDVLADAVDLGDIMAAKRWGICTRTVRRYRVAMNASPELSAKVVEKRKSAQRELSDMRVAFLREALSILRDKLPKANVYSVAGAIKIVGDLHLAATAFEGVSDERPDGGGEEGASPSTTGRDATPSTTQQH